MNVVSRDRFGGLVPRQPAVHSPHSRLNVVLTYGIPPYNTYYVYVEQTAPAAVESRVLSYRRIVQFTSMATLVLLHFVLLLTLLLYLRCTTVD